MGRGCKRLFARTVLHISSAVRNPVHSFGLYAVTIAQTSLAPLSRFRGSHITTAHEQQCCRFRSLCEGCAIANENDKRN